MTSWVHSKAVWVRWAGSAPAGNLYLPKPPATQGLQKKSIGDCADKAASIAILPTSFLPDWRQVDHTA